MGSLQWTNSNAVFITEIDDEHQEIFEAVSNLQKALTNPGQAADIPTKLRHLVSSIVGHFAHEERLMRAARYGSLQWHKKSHDAAQSGSANMLAESERETPRLDSNWSSI